MFWIGALLPIITFFLRKKYPNIRILNAIHWPIFFAGTGNLPPAVCDAQNDVRLFLTNTSPIDWHQLLYSVCSQFNLQQGKPTEHNTMLSC